MPGTGGLGIAGALLDWYRRHHRRLPWRENPTPYSVWVSEIMLQQTRVETVIPYFQRFLERFPGVEALANASLEDVLALWSGLGYYRRARSLHAGARVVLERHAGVFPAERGAALEIPGVGPYTAGAVLSIAFNLPEPVVDGNVERVLTRLLRFGGSPRAAATARWLREVVRAEIPPGQASSFNQALMELGATVCTPLRPNCEECPLATFCRAHQHGDVERYPVLPPDRATVHMTLHAGVVRREDDRWLLERVTSGSFLRGLWLFPLAPGEPDAATPSTELTHRLATCLQANVDCEGAGGHIHHAITFRRLRIKVFRFRLSSRPLTELPTHCQWAHPGDLGKTVPVSSIVSKIAALETPRLEAATTSSSALSPHPPPAPCR